MPDDEDAIVAGAALLYVLLLTAIANLEKARPSGTRILPVLTSLLPVALLWLLGGSVTKAGDVWPRVILAVAGLGSALVMLGLIWADGPWRWVARAVKLASRFEQVSFAPRNRVHRLAAVVLIFAFVALSWQALSASNAASLKFVEAAGAAPEMLAVSLLYAALAVLGVGWLTRRDWVAVKRRLGLHWPRRVDWLAGVATAISLHLFVALAMALWQAVAEPSAFESQVSGARGLFEALSSSLLLGGLLAMVAGMSEEILFRGALQPVFGTLISSLLFVGLHSLVAFTPAAAMLLVVSLGFGLLRARVSTTAAIIAHAAYNAIPFVLVALR